MNDVDWEELAANWEEQAANWEARAHYAEHNYSKALQGAREQTARYRNRLYLLLGLLFVSLSWELWFT